MLSSVNRSTSKLIQQVARSRAQQVVFSRSYKAPLREMNFVTNEVYDFQSHYQSLKHQNGPETNKETVDMILETMGSFCEEVLAPLNEVGDDVGCTHVDEKTVITPPGFKEAYDQFTEAGWQGLSYPEALGGQGLPQSLNIFASEMAATANWTWAMFPGLSKGCINTILKCGSKELQDKWVQPLIAGEWTGTMCLTEPQCGSDLGQVSTRAEPQADGSYLITGTKIFISCGDHDMTNNVIHCVLARLPGAPEGTKGISLFLVPKYEVDDNNQPTTFNHSNIGRIEHKMGCHGSPTCEINFESSRGWLIGQENRGLNHMFTFINTSRLGTAIQGFAGAENAFQNSLWYARERLAMRALSGVKNPNGPADPIIVHPQVRTMLLTQKAIAEGGRSMIYECGIILDKMYEAEQEGNDVEAKKMDEALAFLTPVLKGFLSEVGVEAASKGIQLYGGHGYIKSNKQEQYLRDVRISAVWEGTTQIQGLDFLARKILLGKLVPLNAHLSELRSFCMQHIFSSNAQVASHARTLLKKALEWQYLTMKIGMNARKDRDTVGVAGDDYLMYSGYITLARHWLKMEVVATEALASGKGEQTEEFYKSKQQVSAFVFDNMLPRTTSLKATMFTPVNSVMGLAEDRFSFDL